MTEPSGHPDIADKQADAQNLVAALSGIKTLLDNLVPEPRWFGGLPPTFDTVRNQAEHQILMLQEVFRLPKA